ncbi:MAG TPA: class I SAM-dependent methyltransferase [Daejeonella sp.]|nr:class I SAM-dependent methyltransferase [Daejeonella sp.]
MSHGSASHEVSASAEFLWCDNCRHISIQKGDQIDFDENYNNEQSSSGVANDHFTRIVSDLETVIPDKNARIIEIGCGRGDLLKLLQHKGYKNLQGYDPVAEENSSIISNGYWSGSETADTDLVILRHTLEEIPYLDQFLQKISDSLSPSARVYCEITNASRIVTQKDAFSIYPECSNIFSSISLSTLFQRFDIEPELIHSYFDGAWLGFWGRKITPFPRPIEWTKLLDSISDKINALPRPVVLWGAGGRGGNILSFCQLDTSMLAQVVDLNSFKQGKCIPPFGQQVISPQELDTIAPQTVLIVSNKYKNEILPMIPEYCNVVSIEDL